MAGGLDEVDRAALCRGVRAAWDSFVPAATVVVRAVVRRVLGARGDTQDAADVTQEVFARLARDDYRLLRDFDPARARLSTWLGVIATGAALDWLRRRKDAVPLDQVPESQLPIATAVADHRLRLPAAALSSRQALILTLLYEHDLTPAEVAQLLHIEVQTVRSQRHKALVRLRKLWAGAPR